MKVIGTDNLIKLIKDKKVVTMDSIIRLMHEFGDDFHSEHGISPWKRVEKNQNLPEKLGKDYKDIGELL